MDLTQEQATVAEQAIESLLSSEDKSAAIVGGAGTGKSFVASKILEMLPAGYTATFLAFTNKATYNLEKFVFNAGLGAQCSVSTIHKYLKLSKQRIDDKTGKRTFHKADNSYHDDQIQNPETHLLIIDEAGTVPNSDDSPLVYQIMELPNPILALGDPYQLPPPGEKEGCLLHLLNNRTYELTQVMRYSGGLLDTANYLREHIRESYALDAFKYSNNDTETGLFRLARSQTYKTIHQFVKAEGFIENPDSFRVLTWRKKSMEYWNQLMKVALYSEEKAEERFLIGERIIALESCTTTETVHTRHSTRTRTVKLLSASQEATITDIQVITETLLGAEFTYYFLDLLTDIGGVSWVRVIHESYEDDLTKLLKGLASQRRWSDYWRIKDYFHDIRSALSLNIDRCQGITLENTLIDLDDVMSCKDIYHRNRVAYTMLTRSKYRVYV